MQDGHEARRAEFLKRAGEAFDRMLKEDQEQMITFEQMEDRALEVGGKLETWLMEECIAEAARATATVKPSCPKCGRAVELVSERDRKVRARMGPVTLRRSEAYCPSCRKAFFPSGSTTESRR